VALVTVAQVRELLPELAGGDPLSDAIERAEALIAAWLFFRAADDGAFHLEDSTYTEVVEPRRVQGRELHLRMRPIVSITSIHQSPDESYGASDLVDAGDYELQARDGWVLSKLSNSFGGWSSGYRAIRAVYVAGFGTTGNAPEDVQLAVAWQTFHLLRGAWRLRTQQADGVRDDIAAERGIDPRVGEVLGHRRLWDFAVAA